MKRHLQFYRSKQLLEAAINKNNSQISEEVGVNVQNSEVPTFSAHIQEETERFTTGYNIETVHTYEIPTYEYSAHLQTGFIPNNDCTLELTSFPARNSLPLATNTDETELLITPSDLDIFDENPDIEDLIPSDFDDSVEDPDYVLSDIEPNRNSPDGDDPSLINSITNQNDETDDSHTQLTENLQGNTAFQDGFIAAYPGPIFTTYEEANSSVITQSSNEVNNLQSDTDKQTDQPCSHNNIIINKNKVKHPIVINTCDGKCKRKCNSLSLERRKEIWEQYWDQNYISRRSFLNKCIIISKIKRRKVETTDSDETYTKNESRYFSLPDKDGVLHPVCRKFFLDTLGYKTDSVVTELSKAVKSEQLYASVTKENRGGNRTEIDRNILDAHIFKFNPAVSHYRRHNSPFTRYLPRHLTLQFMFKDFKIDHPNVKCGMETYRLNIKKLKISFNMPKGDRCAECLMYEEEIKQYEKDPSLIPVDVSKKKEEHELKAASALSRYKEDGKKGNSNSNKYFSMDLQKVILLPIMPQVKDAFFLSRLVTFNLTFAPIEPKSKEAAVCVLWHEEKASREAKNIVDGIYAFMQSQRDVNDFNFWADNCTAQNKNWILYTSMVTIVNDTRNNINSVTISYLTKGHTHMSADSVHGNIEKKMRNQINIYDFQDFKDVVMQSRSHIKIIEPENHYQWLRKKRTARTTNDPLQGFCLNEIVEAKFISGSRNLFYKTRFDGPTCELDFLMKKFNERSSPAAITNWRGITTNKKNGILGLVNLMPESRRSFWQNLPVNDESVDLVQGGQNDAD